MKSKFDYDEIVIIHSSKPHVCKYNGYEAIITGKSQSDDDPSIWAYSVKLKSNDKNYFLYETDLCFTGKKNNTQGFHTNETVHVNVNPKTGEGSVSEDE